MICSEFCYKTHNNEVMKITNYREILRLTRGSEDIYKRLEVRIPASPLVPRIQV